MKQERRFCYVTREVKSNMKFISVFCVSHLNHSLVHKNFAKGINKVSIINITSAGWG